MKIVSTNVYVGPNLYAHFPVIRHVLDLGELEAWPTGRLGETFIGALLEALPGLNEHGCSYREPGGFVRRLREDEGTWLGHVMEHVAIELQNVAGSPVTFGRTRAIDGQPGQYTMVFQYHDAEVGRESSRLALELLHSLLRRPPTGILPTHGTSSSGTPSGERSDRARYRSSARPKSATSRGFA
jgi:cyanophycin synthetase